MDLMPPPNNAEHRRARVSTFCFILSILLIICHLNKYSFLKRGEVSRNLTLSYSRKVQSRAGNSNATLLNHVFSVRVKHESIFPTLKTRDAIYYYAESVRFQSFFDSGNGHISNV